MKNTAEVHDKLLSNIQKAELSTTLYEHGWSKRDIITAAVSIDEDCMDKGLRLLERLPKVEETVLAMLVTDTVKFMQNTPDDIVGNSINFRRGDFGYELHSQFMLMTPDLLINRSEAPFNSSAVCYNLKNIRGIRPEIKNTYGVLRCDGVWEIMRCQRSSPTSVRGFSLDPAIYANATISRRLMDSSVKSRLEMANELWGFFRKLVRSSLVSLSKECDESHPDLRLLTSDGILDKALRAVVVSTLSYHLCVVNTPRRIGWAIAKILGLTDQSDWMCDELFRVFVSHIKAHPYDLIWFSLMVLEGDDFNLEVHDLHKVDITNPALPLYYYYTRTVESSTVSREVQTTSWLKAKHNWKPFLPDLVRCGMLTILEDIPLDKEDHEADWIGGNAEPAEEDGEIEYSEHPREDYYAVIPEEVYSHIPDGENHVVLEKYREPFANKDMVVEKGYLLVHVRVFHSYQSYNELRQSTASGVDLPQLVEKIPVIVVSRPMNSDNESEDHEERETTMSLNATLNESLRLGYYMDLTIPDDPLHAIKCSRSKYALRGYCDVSTSVWHDIES